MPPNPRVQRTRSSPSARHSPLTRHPLGATDWQPILLAAVLLVATCCARESAKAHAAVAKIRNSDIAWDGTYVGLVPQVKGPSSVAVLALGQVAVPELLRALDSPDQFAAAHVLLTQIAMNGQSYKVTSSEWNGMRIDLLAGGAVRLHPEQREELKSFWRARPGGA